MGLLKDFKDFALKGNVMDLAIGVIIGAAFGKLVTSLVEDIVMPPLGFLINGIDFTKLSYKLADGAIGADGKIVGEPVVIKYGNFLQVSFQLVVMAFVIFLISRAILQMTRKKEASVDAAPAAPEASAQEKLLAEIRDLLRARG